MSVVLVRRGNIQIDEAFSTVVRNGEPAVGDHVRTLAACLNGRQYLGRPIGAFWAQPEDTDWREIAYVLQQGDFSGSYSVARYAYGNRHAAGNMLRAEVAYLAGSSTPAAYDGAGIYIWGAGSAAVEAYPTYITYEQTTLAQAPGDLATAYLGGADRACSSAVLDMSLGSTGDNGPRLVCGLIYESGQTQPTMSTASALVDEPRFAAGEYILAEETGTTYGIDRLRDRFAHAWHEKRPQIGWSMPRPGARYLSYTNTAWRYLHDPIAAPGAGSGTPGVTQPAITLPLYASSYATSTQVRVAVHVYARMATGTGSAAFGEANYRADGEGFDATWTPLTNAPTVSGTTWQWYPPLATTTPATFMAYTGGSYDRVSLACSVSGGGTLQVGAWTMLVDPS